MSNHIVHRMTSRRSSVFAIQWNSACSNLWSHFRRFYLQHDSLTYMDNTEILLFRTMMTSSNGNFFCVTGPLCGEFTGTGEFPAQRPVTRSFDVFYDLRLNKRLSKQPWGWWFETSPWWLWRQSNAPVTLCCRWWCYFIKKTHCLTNPVNHDRYLPGPFKAESLKWIIVIKLGDLCVSPD